MKPEFDRPFPALTPAQRYHFDVNGYVVVENTLTADEVSLCKDALYKLRKELLELDDPSADGPRVRQAYILRNQPWHCFMGNIIEADPALTAYTTHPRLVGMAAEVMGCEARIVEVNAHINSRPAEPYHHSFHRGIDIPYGTHQHDGLYHSTFVKTLTNLTDLGPDDGGTIVIAGSHKMDLPPEELIAIAEDDPTLIHQVTAPAGSTLLFAEPLIHSTGEKRSDGDRVILICGYGTTMYPYWDSGELSKEFAKRVPPQLASLFFGKAHWTRGTRYRALSDPVDDRPFRLGDWDEREPAPEADDEQG